MNEIHEVNRKGWDAVSSYEQARVDATHDEKQREKRTL